MAQFGQLEFLDMQKNSSNKSKVTTPWWQSICRPASSAKVSNILDYGISQPLNNQSAIDQYLANTEALIIQGTKTLLDSSPEIANLFFIGVVSHTENYFRELFSKLLQICPSSQAKSSNRDIKLGSVIWFKTGQIERGAFESFSFASSENITDTAKRYFDISIEPKSDSHALLDQYDLPCELRHSIVHSAGFMSGKNALKMHFPRTNNNLRANLNFSRFQEATSVCTALVYALNRDFFKQFGARWRDDWPKRVPHWTDSMSNKSFNELWEIFHSKTDAHRNAITLQLSRAKCKAEIIKP